MSFLPVELSDRLDVPERARLERIAAEISGALLARELPDYNPRAKTESECTSKS